MARVVVAALLLAYVPALHGMRAGLGGFDGPRFMVVAGAYLAVAALLVVLSRPGRLPLQRLVDWQLAADVVALTMLLDAAGPLRAGLAMLLLLPNAGAAILLDARRALFFASMSTFALLIVTGWHWMRGDADDASMAQAGMMGAALMACVLLLNWLATRLDRQERLAAQRGEDVRNQLAVTQAVISELPDGVVVLSATGGVRAINPSAREMLGRRVAAPGAHEGCPGRPERAGDRTDRAGRCRRVGSPIARTPIAGFGREHRCGHRAGGSWAPGATRSGTQIGLDGPHVSLYRS
jgi:two-component system sensor histidine kinase PilS (NtrC family)